MNEVFFRLRMAYSSGPHMDASGRERGTACPGCQEMPLEDALITKLNGSWWHQECGQRWLRDVGADEAWLLLGQRLADAPSHFTTRETRAIAENLLRIAQRQASLPAAPEEPYEEPPDPEPRDLAPWERDPANNLPF